LICSVLRPSSSLPRSPADCNPKCSVFIGPISGEPAIKRCSSCSSSMCTGCKIAAHVGEDCVESAALIELKALAAEQHWQTCPGSSCNAIVELQVGCYHMTCRRRMQFCYLCSARWKTCGCDQWDEHRLINAAEHQVENQFGANGRDRQPALYQQRVRARTDVLRQDHACSHANWNLRQGSARCEECGNHLARYILVSSSILFHLEAELMAEFSGAGGVRCWSVYDALAIGFERLFSFFFPIRPALLSSDILVQHSIILDSKGWFTWMVIGLSSP
jgi:hypothetical protein